MSSFEVLQQKIPLNNQIGLIGILLCAFSSPFIMPLNIVAITTKFVEATNGQVGFVATIETLFIAISSIILSRIVNKVNRKNVFLIASLLVMLGNLLTIFSPELNLVIVSRTVSYTHLTLPTKA